MTQKEAIAHWRKGAKDSLESAEILQKAGKYTLTLFHCHLAVEKALKAAFIQEHDKEPPATHDLLHVALRLHHQWTEEEKLMLGKLTHYAVQARYDDPLWAEKEATEANCTEWLRNIRQFLINLSL